MEVPEGKKRVRRAGSAADLFCLGDEEWTSERDGAVVVDAEQAREDGEWRERMRDEVSGRDARQSGEEHDDD